MGSPCLNVQCPGGLLATIVGVTVSRICCGSILSLVEILFKNYRSLGKVAKIIVIIEWMTFLFNR